MADDTGWHEPARALPLRWGSYRGRYAAGITLLFCGGLVAQASSAYALVLLTGGILLHSAGWCILPGKGWRRGLAIAPSAATIVLLLNGASATVFLVIPLAAWLLVRHRPLLSYAALALPAAAAWILAQAFPQYGWGALVLAIAGATLAAAAWLARSLAVISVPNRTRTG